ncbi:ead/Ea22-like family protein [Escherichia albertii]|nr:ead/Ea22-like family protein [Escherichia albertii]MCZ8766628.1 ead/Ea22-like family protein [Escherichia albertii]MCZ8892907.1 ead/Ea22-like family protein [Escherichia albertii]
MSKIDYQALREAAEQAMHDDWGFDADLFHELVTPSIVLALLGELNALEETRINDVCRIAELTKQLELEKSKLNKQREYYEDVISDGSKRIAELEAELVSQTYKLHELSGNSPVTPDGWVMVPKKLTAENGAKGVLSGEFSETTFISCPECFGDDDCDTCDGSGRIEIKVPVTWATIKSIWDKSIEYFAAKPSQEVK